MIAETPYAATLRVNNAPHDEAFWRTLRHPRVLALGAAYFGVVFSLYGVGFWLPQIVQGFGYGVIESGFVTAIPYVCAAIAESAFRPQGRALLAHRPAGARRSNGARGTKLRIEDLDAALIGDFLTHVEKVRRNSARSRNTRLAAIRSFYRYVAMNEPEHALHCQRILAMPSSAMCAGRWTSLIGRRWRRCSPHPINRRGSVGYCHTEQVEAVFDRGERG
jgi:hypothetical protein